MAKKTKRVKAKKSSWTKVQEFLEKTEKKLNEKNFIVEYLEKKYGKELGLEILKKSNLLQFIIWDTKAIDRGSKSRKNYANNYTIYSLVEDYIKNNYHKEENDYSKYEGADFTPLLNRIRQMPGGAKMENHAFQI